MKDFHIESFICGTTLASVLCLIAFWCDLYFGNIVSTL